MKNKLIIFACDTNNKTGEGNLAKSIFKQLNKDFKACFYEDYITKIISREKFLRDRILPFYFIFICLFFKPQKRKLIYLNFCPIWNPFLFLLSFKKVLLGPITGSNNIYPFKKSFSRYQRSVILPFLVYISKLILNSNQNLWVATPSVYKTLKKNKLNITYGKPFLLDLEIKNGGSLEHKNSLSDKIDKTKIFCYSSKHPMKNNSLLKQFLKKDFLKNIEFNIINNDLESIKNINIISSLDQNKFDKLLFLSNYYLIFSFEDAGLTTYKAISRGIELLFPIESPLNNFLESSLEFSLDDLDDAATKLNRLSLKKTKNIYAINKNYEFLENEKRFAIQSFKKWKEWI